MGRSFLLGGGRGYTPPKISRSTSARNLKFGTVIALDNSSTKMVSLLVSLDLRVFYRPNTVFTRFLITFDLVMQLTSNLV